MDNLRALIIGNLNTYDVGAFFVNAAKDLGINTYAIDERIVIDPINSSLVQKVLFRLAVRGISPTYLLFNKRIKLAVEKVKPDFILVVKGAYINPETIDSIKHISHSIVINFATDDPFNPTTSTSNLVSSIPKYDIYCCTKKAIMDDVQKRGCQNTIFIPFAYEPGIHFPEVPANSVEAKKFDCDVVFIGGADADRIKLISEIQKIPGIKLKLFGGYWNKDPQLKKQYYGFSIGREYRISLGAAKIALGLVRNSNRDGHAMRSFEIPACCGFMLAERTEEHLQFFHEDQELVCFSSFEELADKVHYYLNHAEQRMAIAKAGYVRVTTGGNTYKDRLLAIISQIH
jgi:spore maturation protein CgeB